MRTPTTTQTRVGAYWHKGSGKWTANVWFRGQNHHVGSYDNKKSAVIAFSAVARFIGRHSGDSAREL